MSQSSSRLSLCMIVKNEEQFIGSFIDRHRNFFDEWVIVDTGSTDKTVEIIKSKGKEAIPFEWTNDFSAARNYALSKCRGDWVAAFDADEFIDFKGQGLIRMMMENTTVDAIKVQIKNYINEDNLKKYCPEHLIEYVPPDQSYSKATGFHTDLGYRMTELIRFFRNHQGFEWESPIHEVLVQKGVNDPGKIASIEGLYLHHLGMLDLDKKAEKKKELYQSISQNLNKQEAEKSTNPKILFESARFIEDPEEKLHTLMKVLELAPRDIMVLKEMSNICLVLDRGHDSMIYAKKMTEYYPKLLDGHLSLARGFEQMGEPEKGLESLKKSYQDFKSEPMYHYTLACMCLKMQNYKAAFSYAKRAHRLSPNSAMISELYNKLLNYKDIIDQS